MHAEAFVRAPDGYSHMRAIMHTLRSGTSMYQGYCRSALAGMANMRWKGKESHRHSEGPLNPIVSTWANEVDLPSLLPCGRHHWPR